MSSRGSRAGHASGRGAAVRGDGSAGALFEQHARATLRLIDHCAALPAARLQPAVSGTHGSIERTLVT